VSTQATKAMVEKTLYQRFGGTLEPVGEWVDCEDCNGSGEVECDEDTCVDGWIEYERLESCGGGPREYFRWVMYRDPCPKCKPDEEEDDVGN
jgi:DnaJ-class molecular chaperone